MDFLKEILIFLGGLATVGVPALATLHKARREEEATPYSAVVDRLVNLEARDAEKGEKIEKLSVAHAETRALLRETEELLRSAERVSGARARYVATLLLQMRNATELPIIPATPPSAAQLTSEAER